MVNAWWNLNLWFRQDFAEKGSCTYREGVILYSFKASPSPSLHIILTQPRAASLTSQPRSWASLQSNSTRIIYKSQACEQASESNKQVLNVRGLFCFLSSLIEIKAVWIDLQRHEKGMICLLPSVEQREL